MRNSLTIGGHVPGTDVPALDAAHKAAIAGGKPLVCECPPAWWSMQSVLAELTIPAEQQLQVIVIVPEIEEQDDFELVARVNERLSPVHVATGIARTARLLRANQIVTLAATPLDLIRLIEMSAIRTDSLRHLIVGWPEAYNKPATEACEAVLAECKQAGRVIVTSDRISLKDFLDRHARRAQVYQAGSIDNPNRHVIRFAVVPATRRPWALRAALDIINPRKTVIWDPTGRALTWQPIGTTPETTDGDRVGLAVATDIPSATVLSRLSNRAETVLVLIKATQLPYLLRLAPEAEAIRLPSAADRARHSSHVRRAELREKLESNVTLGVLTTLEPLLDEFDPVLIAAAALGGSWQTTTEPDTATWTTVRVDKGKRDGLRPGDLVGALVNAVGLRSGDVGRIDLRGGFSLIEIRPEDASKVTRGLTGLQVKGQRLTARLDDTRRADTDGFSSASRSRRP